MGKEAIKKLGNLNILVGGDPDYQSIVIGNPSPENDLLDPTANIPVSQLVLQTFGIPFSLANVLGGKLPGIDIRNQDATTMLKLSLATELLDPPGGSAGFAEVELDPFGIARFYVAGAVVATNLDIRYCIPTSQITTPADLVIVRGFDPPPERQLRDSFDGLKNKEIMDYQDCAQESCDESVVSQYATISYDDPLLDQVYLDDIINSYELAAFETILGYLIELTMPDETDPTKPVFVPGLKITFGDSTKEYIKIDSTVMLATVRAGTLDDDGIGQITGLGDATVIRSVDGIFGAGSAGHIGSTNAGGIAGTSSTITATVTTVSARGDKCTTSEVALTGSTVTIDGSRFQRLNKYGILESDLIGVTDVVFSGQKILSLHTNKFGLNTLAVIVKPTKELVSLQQGKNWTYEITTTANRDIIMHFFSVIEDEFTGFICDTYRNPPAGVGLRIIPSSDFRLSAQENVTDFHDLICNVGDSFGYRAVDGKICVVLERKRPSIDIFDPRGKALELAEQIEVRYTPIVIVDVPASISYSSVNTLTSIDGSRTLPSFGTIDQTDGIVDSDPATVQDLEDSELSILQDNTKGATIDMTLPFCTATECLQIARNFLSLQNREVSTHSLILGPDSTPLIGDFVTLPNGEIGIINELNYSYSDSSQYIITATVGPLYMTAGSFNDPKYQLRTEDVTREGIIVQDGGNGTEYVVRIEGYGEITALLMVLDDLSVGDKVSIRIYNNPVEKI